MAGRKVKAAVVKARDNYRFGSEKPSSPLFGKSRKDWDAAKAARAKRGKR
jgi:hypothetical protein